MQKKNILNVLTANSTARRLKPIRITKLMLISSDESGLRAFEELRRDVPPVFDARFPVRSLIGDCISSKN